MQLTETEKSNISSNIITVLLNWYESPMELQLLVRRISINQYNRLNHGLKATFFGGFVEAVIPTMKLFVDNIEAMDNFMDNYYNSCLEGTVGDDVVTQALFTSYQFLLREMHQQLLVLI